MTSINSGYTFSYDREGRLEEIIEVSVDDTNKFTFSYTSEGRRLMKVYYRDSSGVIEADTTYYVYDGMNVIAELDGSLDLKSKYVYANGILVGNFNDDDELYQYFHDGLGSVTMICDSTGSYQNLYVYDDFGNFRMMEEAGSVPNSYYYTGQERDESLSGLYNMRARYYAAGIGRFTQEDPLLTVLDAERIQELNGYTYVSNNPINLIDLFGLCGQKQEDCLMVFFDCMLETLLGVKWTSIVELSKVGGNFLTIRAWQYAAGKGLTYPLKSSIFRSKMFWAKTARTAGSVVSLAFILYAEEICIFEEIECLQEQEYGGY